MANATKRYRAFISYSQKDKAWGKRLHAWLESYRVPVGVMASLDQNRRLGRFFRDEEEMPAASDISAVVGAALKSAESQIVICSPNSANSKWVEAEIRNFRKSNPDGHVFAVIIDGSPNSGDPATECFPPSLRVGFDPAHPEIMPIEPVGLDVRIDSKERICARLAAGLLDIDFDELWQRDRRRAEKRQRRAILSLATTSVVFACLAGAAIWFGLDAQRQSEIASLRTAEAEAARRDLQREYVAMLGEASFAEVLELEAYPGVLAMDNPQEWIVLMQSEDQVFAAAREYGQGRVLAVAHDRVLSSPASARGDGFLRRTTAWLIGHQGPKAVVIAAGHCEWAPLDTPDWRLPGLMSEWGYQVTTVDVALDDTALVGAGLLIVGNAWGDFTDAELAAVQRFVEQGGGLLAAGLGWSWVDESAAPDMTCTGLNSQQSVDDIATYPMNRLTRPFGVRWENDVIALPGRRR